MAEIKEASYDKYTPGRPKQSTKYLLGKRILNRFFFIY